MHKSKDYLLESSKSKLDSYRLMYFISYGRLTKLENVRDLKSLGVTPSGFESQIGHQLITSLFSPFNYVSID